MKKTLQLFTILFITIIAPAFSQNVEIPDTSFKKALISFGVDTNLDKEISVAEAAAIDSLVVEKFEIKKLKGIEAFVNLRYLSCADNLLDTIDLTYNTALKVLDISTNGIKSIDLRNNPKLEHVTGQNDYRLQHIDFSNCPELISFNATSNDLQTLDMTNNPKLEQLGVSIRDVPSIDLTKNTALKDLSIIYGYELVDLDLSQNINLEKCAVWLTKKLKMIDFSSCPMLKSIYLHYSEGTESINITGLLDLAYINISYSRKLSFVDHSTCPNLTTLHMSNNALDSVDVMHNFRLKSLKIGGNKLTKLDVSSLDSLADLECGINDLVTLDLSHNPLLSKLQCHRNHLTVLDFTNNPKLSSLYCSGNMITEFINFQTSRLSTLYCSDNLLTELSIENTGYFGTLNCSHNKLTSLDLSKANTSYLSTVDFTSNPDLHCIQVKDTAYANTKWSEKIDSQSFFSLNCEVVTSTNEDNISAVAIYPNPSSDGVFLLSDHEYVHYQLLSTVGTVKAEGFVIGNVLDFSALEKGFYNLTLSTNTGGVVSSKIIIQ